MNNKSAKSIIRKYFVLMTIFFLLMMSLIVLEIIFFDKFWTYLVLVIFLGFMLLVFTIVLETKLYIPVLCKDMNPEKFGLIINSKIGSICRSKLFRVFYYYYSGDYQMAVNMCTTVIKGKHSLENKYNYFLILSRVYFDIGDNEKLKTVCEKFRNYEKDSTKKIKDNTIKLFESYLKEDFDECEKILEDSLSKQTSKTSNIVKMNQVFYTAAIKYYSGDKDTAKKLFEKVICEAPKLSYAKLSEKYIIAIDSSDKSVLSFPEILPEL